MLMWWKKDEVSKASESPKWDWFQIRYHLHEKHGCKRIDCECSEIFSAFGWINAAGIRISRVLLLWSRPFLTRSWLSGIWSLQIFPTVGLTALTTGQHYFAGNHTFWRCLINSYKFCSQDYSLQYIRGVEHVKQPGSFLCYLHGDSELNYLDK